MKNNCCTCVTDESFRSVSRNVPAASAAPRVREIGHFGVSSRADGDLAQRRLVALVAGEVAQAAAIPTVVHALLDAPEVVGFARAKLPHLGYQDPLAVGQGDEVVGGVIGSGSPQTGPHLVFGERVYDLLYSSVVLLLK